ncbi:hypothetical protein NC651_022748 [Populus alba x Populus x berolinensis]|nr:hypothetical protein NC651_022748 [Populus alba x Populus x berolinensis]
MSHPSTELSLALYNPAKDSISNTRFEGTLPVDNNNKRIRSSLFVKVCLDGNSMCRKLDLLAHDGYSSLITTLSHMFNTTTLCTYIYVYIYHFLNNLKTELYCSLFIDIFVKLNYDPLETDPEAVCIHAQRHHHVLTYIDREGDWMMAGDVPWESLNVVLFTLILNVDVQDVLGLSEEIDDYKNIQCISGQLDSNSR